MKTVLTKLAKAREIIKSAPLKKAGHNQFSKYDYFTPEQINALVHEAEKDTGLIHLFTLQKDANGYHGHLDVIDIETSEKVSFIQATDIPSITATNISQQIGGAVTYTNRYMLMTAFDISDNSLDFDAKDNREKQPPAKPKKLPAMPPERFNNMMNQLTKDNAGQLITLARKNFTFTDDQEMSISDWEDNLKTE